MKLHQPIKFKRWKESKWEAGKRYISDNNEWFEDAKGNRVTQIMEWKVDWGFEL